MLVDLAKRDGRRVVALDLFGDLDLRRSASRIVKRDGLAALVDVAVAEAPGAVVYGASFENHPGLVARLAERHSLLGNAPSTLRSVRDPEQLGAALGGLPYPRTAVTFPSSGRWLSAVSTSPCPTSSPGSTAPQSNAWATARRARGGSVRSTMT